MEGVSGSQGVRISGRRTSSSPRTNFGDPGLPQCYHGRGLGIFQVVVPGEGFASIDEGALAVGLAPAHIQLPAKADPVVVDRHRLACLPRIGTGLQRPFTITARQGVGITAIAGSHDNYSQGDVATMSQYKQESSQRDMT